MAEPPKKRPKLRDRGPYTGEERAAASEMERKLMELADLVTNRPNGAEIFHREREACVELAGRLAPGIVEKLQGLPFRANTKGKHGGALDKIIAELKAGEPHRPEAKCPDPPPHDLGAGKRKLPKAAAKREAKGKAQPRPRAARKQAVAEAKPEAVSADPPAAPAPPSGEAKQAALTSFFKSKAVDAVATAPAAPPEAPDMAAAGIDLESYYKELELCPGASLREINTAYRKRALQTHPDKGGSSASFRRVQAAYVALTDSLRKAEEETSLSECSDRLFAALLLRGECPADELKLYKIEVLRKFKDKLQAMSKQMQVTMDVELDENNSKGLSRNRTGFAVDVSWRSFRMRATHIPTLEQALAIHVAAVTTRQRALARFNMYLERRRATGQMGKTAEEVHPLERQELEALMAEAPWTFQFASDVHGKTRVMSPWTPCLASALEFRGLIYAAIDAAKEAKERPGNMTRIATLKKQMAKEAAQHREDAPRARAALLEAIDQCIEAEPARPSEAIPQQTKAIENCLLTRQLNKLYEEKAEMKLRQEKLRLDLERSKEKNAALTDINSDLAREICTAQNRARAAECRHEAERQGNLRLAKSMQAEKRHEEALRTERWKGHGYLNGRAAPG